MKKNRNKVMTLLVAVALLFTQVGNSVFASEISRQSIENIIYLDGVSGDDTYDGLTAKTAVKTINMAQQKLGHSGTIVICGDTTIGTYNSKQIGIKDKSITIRAEGDGSLTIDQSIALLGDVTFKNLKYKTHRGSNIYANGHTLAFGQEIEPVEKDKEEIYFAWNVYGGNENYVNGNTNIIIESGAFRSVYGGGKWAEVGNGTANITVTGGSVNEVYGGGQYPNANIDNTNISITGGIIETSVYGGGDFKGSKVKNTAIKISNKALIKGGVYGGGRSGEVLESTNVTIDGGKTSAVYGGSEYRTVGGNANVHIANDAILGTVYGGGAFEGADVAGHAVINIDGNAVINESISGQGNKGKVIGNNSVILGHEGKGSLVVGKISETNDVIIENDCYVTLGSTSKILQNFSGHGTLRLKSTDGIIPKINIDGTIGKDSKINISLMDEKYSEIRPLPDTTIFSFKDKNNATDSLKALVPDNKGEKKFTLQNNGVDIVAMPYAGNINIENQQKEDVPKVQIYEMDKLKDMVITEEDKEAIRKGDNINIIFKVEKLDITKDSPEEKSIAAILHGRTLGTYLDIKLLKQVGNNEPKELKEIPNKIKITIDIPDSILANGDTARIYDIVHLHNGVAEIIKDIDDNPKTITIETDKFSTFAIAYKDKIEDIGNAETGTLQPDNKNQSNNASSNVPKTGDNNFMFIISIIAMLSLITIVGIKKTKTMSKN